MAAIAVDPTIRRQVMSAAREVLAEITAGTGPAVEGMRPLFESTLGAVSEYIGRQMAAGRIRPMHPILALQAFVGPVFFHLMTRPAVERIIALPMDPEAAVDELVAASLAGLRA